MIKGVENHGTGIAKKDLKAKVQVVVVLLSGREDLNLKGRGG